MTIRKENEMKKSEMVKIQKRKRRNLPLHNKLFMVDSLPILI